MKTVVAGIATVALIGVAAIVVGAWAISARGAAPKPASAVVTAEVPSPAAASAATSSAASTESASVIEVPALVGLSLDEAQTVVSATGMGVQVYSEDSTATGGVDNVVSQEPGAGELADIGTTVVLHVRAVAPVSRKATAKRPAAKKPVRPAFVVCIDPGHQAHSDSSPEPIGPGASQVRPKVAGGATGVKTHIPEYEIALQIATNLRKRLEARGVKVVMTRDTNDVDLPNSSRAAIANDAKADLLVRVHADGSPNSDAAGISTLYPAVTRWTKGTSTTSKKAARLVQASAVAKTGAVDRGIVARSDLSGFNYCKRPAILIETGFVSNPVEDRLLASPHYQDKVAEGIAVGVMDYLQWAASR